MNSDIFCKKTLWNSKTAVTFAYDIEKNSLIYQKIQHEKLHPNLTTYGRLGFFKILKFQKEKKLSSNLIFLKILF